jgi:hypothetical protein
MAVPAYESEMEMESLHEWESELESSGESSHEAAHEWEVNPANKVYVDALMEHLAHEAVHAESEQEAAEGFLPLIPMIAGKLLPLAAKALPKLAGKFMPNIARSISRVTPNLTRGVTQLTRGLFRNPRTRPLVRTVPSIARRAVTSLARRAAAGQPITPQTARRALVQQARSVLRRPQVASAAIHRSRAMDRHFHRIEPVTGPIRVSTTCHCGGGAPRPRPCCGCCGHVMRGH